MKTPISPPLLAEAPAFEGPEKKLHVEVTLPAHIGSLRRVSRTRWDALLARAHCSVLGVSSNDVATAYVLLRTLEKRLAFARSNVVSYWPRR